MRPSTNDPIGLDLTRTAKLVSRAFDDALAEAGGTLPMGLVLMSLKGGQHGAQRDIAAAIGVEGPTLTHHLNRMETAGLVTRTRDPQNRRAHLVELTADGDATFRRLLGSVVAFDARLRRGFDEAEVGVLQELLGRLRTNVTPDAVAQEGDEHARHR